MAFGIEKQLKKFEQKLESLGFKPENNFTLGIRKPTFLKAFFLGGLSQKTYLIALNQKQVILLELTLFSTVNDKKEPIIFDRKDVEIIFKKGILRYNLIFKEKENPKNIFNFFINRTFLKWQRENTKNMFRDVNGIEY